MVIKKAHLAIVAQVAVCALISFQFLQGSRGEAQLAGSCYLAEHDDVICNGGKYDPGTDIAPEIPGMYDPAPGPPPLDGTGDPIFLPPVTIYLPDPGCIPSPSAGADNTKSACNGQSGMDAFLQKQQQIEGDGGFKVYADTKATGPCPTAGCLTECYGHLCLAGDGCVAGAAVSQSSCNSLFQADTQPRYNSAVSQAGDLGICDGCFIAALAGADFNEGSFKTRNPTTYSELASGDYSAAAANLGGSAYGKTPNGQWLTNAIRALPAKGAACNKDDSSTTTDTATITTSGNSSTIATTCVTTPGPSGYVAPTTPAPTTGSTCGSGSWDDSKAAGVHAPNGWCARGTAAIGAAEGYPMPKANATDWANALPGLGWVKVAGCTPQNAAPGTLLTYQANNGMSCGHTGSNGLSCGHVEFKTGNTPAFCSSQCYHSFGGSVPGNDPTCWVYKPSGGTCTTTPSGTPADATHNQVIQDGDDGVE